MNLEVKRIETPDANTESASACLIKTDTFFKLESRNNLTENCEELVFILKNDDFLRKIRTIETKKGFDQKLFIYLLDGQAARQLVPALLEVSNTLRKDIILVGIDSDPDKRNEEYITGNDPIAYKNHMEAVAKYIHIFINQMHDNQQRSESTAILGFSNGASFALSAALTYPNLFGNLIAFSIARDLEHYGHIKTCDSKLKIYIEAGSQKSNKTFQKYCKKMSNLMSQCGHEVCLRTSDYGHDFEHLFQRLPNALVEIFGPRRK